MRRRDSQGLWDGHVHTAIFKTEPTRNYCIAHNSAQCYVATWMGGEVWGRMDPCLCMAESLFCTPETITTLSVSYTPIQNKKF